MSTTVRIWITIMLVSLMALTGVVLWKATQNRNRSTEDSQSDRSIRDPDAPVDLASYEMVKRNGEKFNFGELNGHVWVASTFFSSCTVNCKTLNTSISTLRKYPELEGVKFISISVDPAVDTPEVLTETAKEFGADENWLFLNGKLSEITRFGREVPLETKMPAHDGRLVLFDHEGVPRGFYLFTSGEDIVKLRVAAAKLKKAAGIETPKPEVAEPANRLPPHDGEQPTNPPD
jgi:protein SCO1/2